jgi:glycosyltransferase involved in cell wall biosynthesis
VPNILLLTTDLPFFPGKHGVDFFNVRYLAEHHRVGVIAPCYEWFPAQGVENLEKAVWRVYAWPHPVAASGLEIGEATVGDLRRWVHRLPTRIRRRWMQAALGLVGSPADAHEKLAILANCAPHLLRSFADSHWHAAVLIQSNLEPWVDFLPGNVARVVYFHDVRSDYLKRVPAGSPGQPPPSRQAVHRITRQEARICTRVEVAGFVSDLDRQRAVQVLHPPCETAVAPIPVDTAYFTPAPPGSPKGGTTVLFTGHLSHPPNVDAVVWFIREVWPLVRSRVPEARFCVAGMIPHDTVREACATGAGIELHENVPDIRPFFWSAQVYVVPMRFGGGVRQKIFEAWSMGVPLVATPMAVEGTPAADGENCLLSDTPAGLAECIADVLQKPDANGIRQRAKETVQRTNSIPVAAARFQHLAERAVHLKQKRPFRMLYDLRWMEIGRAGGVEQMVHELVDRVVRVAPENQFRLYCPRSTYFEWDFRGRSNVRGFFSDPVAEEFAAMRDGLANRLAESVARPAILSSAMRTLRRLNRMDFDIVHSPINYIHPEFEAFPNVLTVLDIQHIHHPEFFTETEWKERERLYRRGCSLARHIICISEATRQDVHRVYNVPLDKMTTVWIAPSRSAWVDLAPSVQQRLLRELGVAPPFLFFPGHCWPHKNHARLVEAFAMAIRDLPANTLLVFTGRPFPEDHPAAAAIQAHGLERRVLHLGFRSNLELRALYHGAHALVFPSLFEGFGIPLVEAMIANCPVACSNNTSLPEIAGDAAVYFDAGKTESIATTLVSIARDQKLRSQLVQRGRERLPLFDGRYIALKTIDVYRRVHQASFS